MPCTRCPGNICLVNERLDAEGMEWHTLLHTQMLLGDTEVPKDTEDRGTISGA